MSEAGGDGVPFFFAAEQAPSATVIDEVIYLTIMATNPMFPGQMETVDIMLSTDTAARLIAALDGAVGAAAKNAATVPPH